MMPSHNRDCVVRGSYTRRRMRHVVLQSTASAFFCPPAGGRTPNPPAAESFAVASLSRAACLRSRRSPPRRSVWELVKEEIDGGNLAVPGDYEIGSGVTWRLARATRHPPDPTAIAHLLRRGERLILEVGMT